MPVKFSELREGQMIEHNGEVMYKHKVEKLILEGKQTHPLYTISKEWTESILKKAWRDQVELVENTEKYSAINQGELIEIDILEGEMNGGS